jgi:hypothetical protein
MKLDKHCNILICLFKINSWTHIVHHLNKGKYLERKSNAIFCMITHFSKERMREGGLFVFIDCLDCLPKLNLIMYITVVKIVITVWDASYYLYNKIKNHSHKRSDLDENNILTKSLLYWEKSLMNCPKVNCNHVLHSFPCFL